MQQTNVSKKNLWKPDSYIILLNYHFCMLFTSGQRLHTEQRILYCYLYIIKSTWIMQLSFLLHISSVSIFHFLYYKQWRGGTCFWPVIFLLQPVIWRQKGGDLTQSYDKSPHTHGNVKRAVTTQTTPQKSSIKQLRTDLGRSVGVTTATQLVWLTWFTGPTFPLPATAV